MSNSVKEEEFQHGEVVGYCEGREVYTGVFCCKYPSSEAFIIINYYGELQTVCELQKPKTRPVTEKDIGKMVWDSEDPLKERRKLLAVVIGTAGFKNCLVEDKDFIDGYDCFKLELAVTYAV